MMASFDKPAGFGQVVEALRAGRAAVFPTDTVYGLGVSVLHAKTPQPIFDIKQRAADKPVAWLVAGPGALDKFGADVPERARRLAAEHWPGALTIIVKANESVPLAFRPASGTIGLRMPDSQTALALIRELESPLATSSANLSGRFAPHVFADIDPRILQKAAAIDCDEPASGVASTVIDCSQGVINVVRQGDVFVS